MMREILFRGKRLDDGEWVDGDLLSHDNRVGIHNQLGDGTMNVIDIDPETVGQFTGLKDSTGKRIFEGDIVKLENFGSFVGIVKYGEFDQDGSGDEYEPSFCLGFYIELLKERLFLRVPEEWEIIKNNSYRKCQSIVEFKSPYHREGEIEVIGNIHDNPELLEVE